MEQEHAILALCDLLRADLCLDGLLVTCRKSQTQTPRDARRLGVNWPEERLEPAIHAKDQQAQLAPTLMVRLRDSKIPYKPLNSKQFIGDDSPATPQKSPHSRWLPLDAVDCLSHGTGTHRVTCKTPSRYIGATSGLMVRS